MSKRTAGTLAEAWPPGPHCPTLPSGFLHHLGKESTQSQKGIASRGLTDPLRTSRVADLVGLCLCELGRNLRLDDQGALSWLCTGGRGSQSQKDTPISG